ncbi:MAG: methyltransferase domain-containing protein [Clostridia bacterium]|nr:methyltransferase domain-containing protein [Clostridia bacterium]
MVDLLSLQKYFILSHLGEGHRAVDFTMGNGHDTEFLSKTVGPGGQVTAFDIQPKALESTAKNLREWGCPENWRLICDSHHNAINYIDGKIKAGMFNLGYMPGSGNKALTTMRETTLPAVENALTLLDRDAILMVAVYPGHPEGALEGEELQKYFATLSRYKLCIAKFQMVNSPTSPYFIIAETK